MARLDKKNWHVDQSRTVTDAGVRYLKELRSDRGFHPELMGAGTTFPQPWATDLHNPGGVTAPVVQYLTDIRGGGISVAKSIDNAAEAAQLTFGDQLQLPFVAGTWFETLIRIPTGGGPAAANERIAWGLASNHTNSEDGLNAVVTNAWFLLADDLDLLVETDDGTTDNDDQDTGFDVVENTWYHTRIEVVALSRVIFRWAAYTEGSAPIWPAANALQLSMAALAANTLVQPIFVVQQDGASGVRDLEIQMRACEHDGWLQ